jgi:hypothetical protein
MIQACYEIFIIWNSRIDISPEIYCFLPMKSKIQAEFNTKIATTEI